LTISLGVAVVDSQSTATYEQMCELAAEALGEAKASGRNRFVARDLCIKV
jgi:PleD family two-component response regulator